MRGKAWKISIALGIALGIGLALKSLYFKSGTITSPTEARPKTGSQITQQSDREPGPSGLPPCFFLQPPWPAKKPNIGDCLLLVPEESEVEAFEVNLHTGLFVLIKTDLFLPGTQPIVFTRTFRPWSNWSSAWEIPAAHVFDIYPTGSRHPYTFMYLNLPDGEILHYLRISPGTSYSDAVYEHTGTRTALYGSRVKWNGTGWDLTLKDGTVYVFPDSYYATRPAQGAVVGIRDRYGHILRLARDSAGNLIRITSPDSRWLEFNSASNGITQVKDSLGRVVQYAYDAHGRVAKVTDFNARVTEYTYDQSNHLLTIKDPRGVIILRNEYDPHGRVIRQTQADGSSYQFRYMANEYGNTLETDVIDPRGNIKRVYFNGSTYIVTSGRSPSPGR